MWFKNLKISRLSALLKRRQRTISLGAAGSPARPENPPPNVIDAAVLITRWAQQNNLHKWRIAGCCSEDYTHMAGGAPNVYHVAVVQRPPTGWREFLEEASTCAGRMVSGNLLSIKANRLLAAPPDRPDFERRSAMTSADNDALCSLNQIWDWKDDWMVCRACNRPLIASLDGQALIHKEFCKNTMHGHPWAALRAIIAAPAGTRLT